jgi:hypothetical protein
LPQTAARLAGFPERNEVFKLVSTRSAEFNAINNALSGSASAADLRGSSLQPSLVHFRTPPRITPGGYEFSVDFGSAPKVAFDELLAVIGNESSRITFGSWSYG